MIHLEDMDYDRVKDLYFNSLHETSNRRRKRRIPFEHTDREDWGLFMNYIYPYLFVEDDYPFVFAMK